MQVKSYTSYGLVQAIREGMTLVLYDTENGGDDVLLSEKFGEDAIEDARQDVLHYEEREELRKGASLKIANLEDLCYLLESFFSDHVKVDEVLEARAKVIFDRALNRTGLDLRLEPVSLDEFAESADSEEMRRCLREAVWAARADDSETCLTWLQEAEGLLPGQNLG